MFILLVTTVAATTCGFPECSNQGTCSINGTCLCYSSEPLLPDCSLTRSGCSLTYCSGAGQCVNASVDLSAVRCTCKPGYYGPYCEIREEHCSAVMCSGLSNCSASGCDCPRGLHQDCSVCDGTQASKYKCRSCVDGMFGPRCDVSQATCDYERCHSHGFCSGNRCRCRGAYTESSNCASHLCPGEVDAYTLECICQLPDIFMDGTCARPCVGGAYDQYLKMCICWPGFLGSWCQYSTPEDIMSPDGAMRGQGLASMILLDVAMLWLVASKALILGQSTRQW